MSSSSNGNGNGNGKRSGDAASLSASDPFVTNDFFPLNQASNAVLAALRADESSPDADLYRRIASSSNSSTAAAPYSTNGNNNQGHLYNTNATTTNSTTNSNTNSNTNATTNTTKAEIHNTIHHENSIPLPPYLTNIIKETKLSSLMGILPQGNMVWVSVDDSLYIWEYGQGSLHGHGNKKEDFVCFQVPSGQCVVSVGIVKPKPGTYHTLLLDCYCLIVIILF